MTTRAYSSFERSIERAKTLLEVHNFVTKQRGRPPQWASDILRAVLVFIMASWDSYVHDVVQEISYPLIKKHKGCSLPKKLLEVLKEAIPYEKLLEIYNKGNHPQIIPSAIRKRNAGRTFMKSDKAEEAFKIIGIDDPWRVAAKVLRRRRDSLRNAFDNYANKRDRIAHEGDVGKATKAKGKLGRMTRPFIDKALDDVERTVEAIDHDIEARINAK